MQPPPARHHLTPAPCLPSAPLQCVEHLEIVRTACRELQGCASFSKLLQAVLELGNHLNQVGGSWGGLLLLLRLSMGRQGGAERGWVGTWTHLLLGQQRCTLG